jgi:CshA-type fibril repeat protein
LGQSVTTTYTPTVQPPTGPTAIPDTSSGPFNTAQLKTVVTNDASNTGTAISASSVKLFDPATSTYVTSPVTTAEGVYSIVSGQVQFMPTAGFVGTATAITYQITDSLGQTATTTYTPTVDLPEPPTATSDTTTGFMGVAQSINVTSNDSAATGVTLDASTVKLCNVSASTPEVAPNCSATTVDVPNV